MTKLLTQAIEKVRELPAAEQDEMATTIFAHMTDVARYRLTDEQVREVRARMAEKNPRYATKKQMDALWKMCGV